MLHIITNIAIYGEMRFLAKSVIWNKSRGAQQMINQSVRNVENWQNNNSHCLIYKSNLKGRSSAEFHCNKWQGMQEIGAKVERSTEKIGIKEVKNGERTSDCKKESG